jgi:hypothetical protein
VGTDSEPPEFPDAGVRIAHRHRDARPRSAVHRWTDGSLRS